MKKKNQKGFTLVELMGVILILGIVLLIAIPAVTKFLGKSKNQYYETTIDNIESATEEFLMDYDELVPPAKDGGTVYETSVTEFYLKNLVDLKYLDSVEDPNTHASCDEDSYVVVTNTGYDAQYSSDGEVLQGANQNLEIDVCLKCGDETINDHNSKCSTVKKHYAFVDNNTEEPISTLKINAGRYYPRIKNFMNNTISAPSSLYTSNKNMVAINGNMLTISNGSEKSFIYTTYREQVNGKYNHYIIPLFIDVIDELVLPEKIVAQSDNLMVYSGKSNGSVSFDVYPYNAKLWQNLRCAIINKNENNEVYQPESKTYYGSVNYNLNSNGGFSCKLKNFYFSSASIATKDKTDTYIRAQSINPSNLYVDIPIYNYYG